MLNKPASALLDGLRRQVGADDLIIISVQRLEDDNDMVETAMAMTQGLPPSATLLILKDIVKKLEEEIQ